MPPKRKRSDHRGPSDNGPSRPAPHRPDNTSLGQHDRGYDGGRGGGGRNGRNTRRPDRRDSNQPYNSNNNNGNPNPPILLSASRPPSSSSTNNLPPINTAPPTPAPIQTAAAPTPVPPPQPTYSAPPSPIQPGYDYSIITDDRISRWSKGARQEVIDHGVQSRDDEDLTEVAAIFQELIHSAVNGRLPGTDAGKVIKDILGPEPSEADRAAQAFDAHTLFLDTVATFMDVENAPFRPQLRDLMYATEVSTTLMRQILDAAVLQLLGLVRDTFVRVGIRQSTNLLYRQANYNLLREETEGYSKLVTELFTTSSAEPPSSEVVQAAFNKVMGLIGTFDLHPGRVLDVTLDVFASVLIKQFRFFIKFLRVSSWWPRTQIKLPPDTFVGGLPIWALPDHSNWVASEEEEKALAAQRLKRDIAFWDRARKIKLDAFFELGGRQIRVLEDEELPDAESRQESSIEKEWIKITKTLPPTGNRDAAQMLGFKLRFYTTEARDSEDMLPANLLYLLALLIKVGFITLTDLWEHIWPADDMMEAVKEARFKELEEKERANRPGGAANALMMAGALPDDMAPPPMNSRRNMAHGKADADTKATAETVEEKPKLPEPDDQKVILLKCLLTIGAIPESLFIIGRHDWILQAHPDLLPLVHRILHHSVETVYQQSRPRPKSSVSANCPGKKLPDMDQSGVPKGSVRLAAIVPKRALRWPFPDETNEGGGYRFYWDEWADNVPVCQTVDDIFTLCDTFVNIIGVNIGQDAGLIAKLTSIGAKSMADDQSPANRSRWLLLLKRLLVPSLSLLETNSSVVDSVWTLLKQFPIHVRYNVYAEWYEGQTSRLEPMKKAFARTRLETLSTMKRLSLTNIPQMAKTLAKTAYPSPGIVCKVALQQIESYSNLIEAFVECAKYFTDLGYDVLVWSVLSSLGGQQRSRTQESSVLLTSKWLQALSRFSGKVFLRYSTMDPTPILRYVDNQLSKGNSTDLVILKELISSMGGVVSDLDFTDAQLHAMTGGELLRRETLTNLGDKRYVSTKSADRLIRALMTNGLAGRLLANIAQYRQSAISAVVQGDAHIKYLATMADDTHQVLLQYLDLLRSSLDGETFNNLVPSVIRLMRDYGLGAGLAFLIGRASIRTAMNRVRGQSESHTPAASTAPDTDGDVAMTTVNGDDAANMPAADGPTTIQAQGANERKVDPVLEPFQPVIDEIPTVLSEDTLRYLTPACYVLFWALQLGDLSFPQDNYSDEVNRLKRLAREVMNDRSDMTRNGMNKKTQKQAEINARVSYLLKENSEELQRYSKFRFQLSRQLTTWFPADMAKVKTTADTMLEECILPRLQLSGLDAEYSFRFLKFLHEFSAPNFQLMAVYDRLFQHNRIRSMLFTCTVREAEHIGRFLKCILSEISRWHGDKNAYEKEALGSKEVQKEKKEKTRNYVGFATEFDADGKPTKFVEHDAFRDLVFKWHKELNSALRACLDDMEWMHIRNAITVLKAVIDFFPAINFMAEKFLAQLKTITEREAASKNAPESEAGHRVDLSVTAQTAFSELQKRKSKWIMVQAFRPGITGDSKEESKSQHRTTAPATNDNPRGRKHTAAEVEDGEVKDSRSGRSGAASGNLKDSAPTRNLPTREPQKDVNPPQRSMGGNGPPPRPPAPNATPLPAKLPGNRNDANRSSTLNSGGRGLPSNPDLPRRPDVPIPEVFSASHFNRGQHNINNNRRDAAPSRDSRDAREPREARDPRETHPREPREPAHGRDNRDHRAPETSRPERPRDFPSTDRRPTEPSTRDSSRLADRDWPNRAEPPARWTEPAAASGRDGRQPRDRTPHGASRHDGRLSRENAGTAPSVAASAHNDAPEPPINPERARLLAEIEQKQSPHPTPPRAAETQHAHINPARAALITDVREPQGRTSSRDQTRERPPRTESPRASERSATNQADNARDDRQGRHRHSDYHNTSRDSHAHGESSHGRLERPAEIERPGGSRDGSYSQPSSRGADHDHVRSGQQDPNYGRLNPIQSIVDSGPAPVPVATSGSGGPPPSGPRGRGRNNARMVPANGVPIRPDGRFPGMEANRTSSPDRQPPTGPSSSRQSRRGQYDNTGGNVSTPSSSLPTPAPGVHPDRMGHINQQAPPGGQSNQQQSQAGPSLPPPQPPSAPGVHPDRLNQINPERLNQINGPPSHRPTGPSAHNRPPINTPDRPSMSAPNNSGRQQPSAQHGSNFGTPTGPSAANNDRMRSGGGSRQLRGIQNMLDKASMDARGPGSRMRGSSRLNTMVDSDAQVLAGASPGNTPVSERPDPVRDIRESGSRSQMSTDRGDRERDRGRDSSHRESRDREPRGGLAPIQVVGDSREDSSSVPHGDHSRGDVNGEGYGSSSRGGASGDHERGSSRHHSSRSERSDRPSRRSSRERNQGGGGGDGKESSSRGDYSRESRSRGGVGSSSGPSTANAPGGPSADLMTGGSSRDRRSGRDSNAGSGSGHRGGGGGDMPPPPPSREPSHRGHGGHRNGGDGSSHNQGGQPPMGGGRNDSHGRQSRESRSSRPSGPGGGHDDMRGGGDDRSRKRRGDGVIDSSQGLGGHQDKRPRR